MGFFTGIKNVVKFVQLMGDGSYYGVKWSTDLPNTYSDKDKLAMVLQNPAALFLFTLLPDIFSMGKWKMYTDAGEEVEKHELLDLLKNPNFRQTGSQFKWDYMFWRLLGTAHLYVNSSIIDEDNALYFLSPDQIEWNEWFETNKATLILTREKAEEIEELICHYKTTNQRLPFEFGQLQQFFDISNGIGNWYEGPSRLDALRKVLANAENSIDSKNITSHLARKFWVSGKTDPSQTKGLVMGDQEKKSIEDSIMSKKNIHASRYMSDIKSFVSDAGVLGSLDAAFMNDAFIVGKTLNIPKNVIELLGDDATYENQEKARAAIVSYCLQAPADDFGQGLLDHFGIQGATLSLDFSHLPFVQVFEKEKAETTEVKSKAMVNLVRSGVKQEDAAREIGWDFTEFNAPIFPSGNQNPQGNEGEEQDN